MLNKKARCYLIFEKVGHWTQVLANTRVTDSDFRSVMLIGQNGYLVAFMFCNAFVTPPLYCGVWSEGATVDASPLLRNLICLI